ncbi:site-specific DNA methylase [Thiovulum sp. ES]|nr:site-specific DNA methylase [Thiovulum sp. ES]
MNLNNPQLLYPRLSPLLKWAGGKERELKYILPEIPEFKRYFEPFVGGGAVYFAVNSSQYFLNDKSHELIELYKSVKTSDKFFFDEVSKISENWKNIENRISENRDDFLAKYKSGFSFPEISKKIERVRKLELKNGELVEKDILDNIESAFKAKYYTELRGLYNSNPTPAIFFFIRNFAYSGMFRYNKDGEFNVPYGGIGYNKKDLRNKLEYFKDEKLLEHLAKTEIENLDFEDFFQKWKPEKDDFIFLDPPYDSEFSTYAKNEFIQNDHVRLRDFLAKTSAKWLMVISETEFISELYKDFHISDFKKEYQVSFKNRNNKKANHLIIKNYV